MGVHRDPKSGEEWEPLNEHATFRLGIDYGFRNAFKEGQPMSRAGYELMSNNGGAFAYFTAPPYEEYLRLCDMYSRTQRLRAEGLSGIDAAEAVRKRGLSDHIPLDQASFEKVGIHPDLRGAFTQGRALSQNEYELVYVFEPVLPEGVTPYDDYASHWYYGETGVGPMSREDYTKQHCFVAPPYNEYLRLYNKYSELSGQPKS